MKAKQRTLAVLVVLAVLLGGALWAVNRTKTVLEEAADAASEGSIPLAAVSASNLTQIQVTYNGETNTLDYADNSWTLAEDPAYHLDAVGVEVIVKAGELHGGAVHVGGFDKGGFIVLGSVQGLELVFLDQRFKFDRILAYHGAISVPEQ